MQSTIDNFFHVIAWRLALVYFLPTIVAIIRNHARVTGIFWINLIFGWTGIGWVVAQVWSFINEPGNEDSTRGKSTKPLKIVIALYYFLNFVFVFFMFAHRPADTGDSSKAETQMHAPAPPTGVPAPADEILGK